MKTLQLGTTGEHIGSLALGAMLFGTTTDEQTAGRMLDRFADSGGTHVDTANCYCWWAGPQYVGDESEEVIGRWLARTRRRDEMFIATKGSGRIPNPARLLTGGVPDWERARSSYEGAGADTLRAALDGSLRRLQTDHIDLYYVHVDDRRTPLEETLETLHSFVVAGKVRHIGWSNVRTWRLERARALATANAWTVPIALQQQHSYLQPAGGIETLSVVGDEQLDYLAAHDDLTLFAYSPTLGGSYDDDAKWAGHWQRAERYATPSNDERRRLVHKLAGEVGCTPNQLALAWLMARPRVSPITGVRTYEQFAQNLAAAEVELPEQVLAQLDGGRAA